MKKIIATLLATAMTFATVGSLAACGGDDDNGKTIKVWAPAASINAYKELVADFKTDNPDYKDWNIVFENKEEGIVQGSMSDPKAGANIFFFPSDHLNNFAFQLQCLQPLTKEYEDLVKERDNADSVSFVTKTIADRECVCAFPATDDNGYFLWYDSSIAGIEDNLDTWDKLVAFAKEKNKKVLFNYGDTYYAASFFLGTGTTFDYKDDQLKEYVTDVDGAPGKLGGAAYMRYFTPTAMGTGNNQVILQTDPSSGLAEAFKNNTIVAGVGGTWVKESIKNAVGDKYSNIKTAVLPKFTTTGADEYYMKSFIGSKYCGVNSNKSEEQIIVSLAFANYLTSEKGQQIRYNSTGAGPTNKAVNATQAVTDDPVLATYRAQKAHGYAQKDQPSEFWNGINAFVTNIAAGKTKPADLQTALNKIAADLRK